MRRVKSPPRSPGRKCHGKGCEAIVYGGAQLCDTCQAAKLLCRNCGNPHGGLPATTKLCAICRRGKKGKPRGPRNPPWTEAEDALIRDLYAKHNAHEVGPALRAAFASRPSWSVKRRACVIGAATVRRKEPPWSPEERAALQELSWMTPERISVKFKERGYHRTLTAISVQVNRSRTRQQIDGHTAQSLARMLDVDGHKVLLWIEQGMLAAERCGTTGDHHDRHHITTEAIRTFLLAHPEQYELSRLERAGSKLWFLELVTHGRISEMGAPVASEAVTAAERTFPLYGERVTLAALSDISGRAATDLLSRIDGLGMSVEGAAFGEAPAEEPVTSTLGLEVAKQLRALTKAKRLGPVALAKLGLPKALVARVMSGTLPIAPPALLTIARMLGAEVRVTVTACP